MNLHFSLNFKKLVFLIPLIIFANPAYAQEAEIQMDWIIEGQLDKQTIASEEAH